MGTKPVVLIAMHHPDLSGNVVAAVRSAPVQDVHSFTQPEELLEWLGRHPADIIFVDNRFCLDRRLVPLLRRRDPDASIVVLLEPEDLSSAMDRIREGAVDCIPLTETRDLADATRRISDERSLKLQSVSLRRHLLVNHLENPYHFEHMVTQSAAMISVFMFVEAVAASSYPVLITGETGTGKDLLARTIHDISGRSGPFVAENIASVDDELFTDMLFGHLPGAYTGADGHRPGLIEAAHGGTIFLDEIGDLSLRSQVKLLRVIENSEFYPLGSDAPRKADVRFVVATNQNLDTLMARQQFRTDLYYRLSTHMVELPPLRDRDGDIPLLTRHILSRLTADINLPVPTITEQVYRLLNSCRFPGNVRELQSLLLHAIWRCGNGELALENFHGYSEELDALIQNIEASQAPNHHSSSRVTFSEELPTREELTDLLIQEALRRTGGNQSRAGQLIGLTPSAINKRLRRWSS